MSFSWTIKVTYIVEPQCPPPSNLAVLTGDHTNKVFFGGGFKKMYGCFARRPGQYLVERMLSDHFHHFEPQGVTVEEAVEAV